MYNDFGLAEKNNNCFKNSFLLATCGGSEVIEHASVIRIEAISNYSKLFFTNGKTVIVAKVLAHFEALLAGKGFVRLHRSHLVNMQFIRAMRADKTVCVVLQNSENITVSKRKKHFVKQSFRAFMYGAHAA